MELHDAIRGRRTADAFAGEAPPREVIERLIDTAIWAPNHHLTEPWRFVVIAGAERRAIGDAIGDWLEQGGHDQPPGPDDVLRARRSMMGSPVTIAVAQAASDNDPVQTLEDYAACCCVVQNLMLAAQAEGLASKWATGRLSRYAGAKQSLGLDSRDRIVAYVQVGYAAPGAEAVERRRTPARVVWRGM